MSANNTIKEDVIQQQILQAAQQLFQKHGYQKVTMDDVARAIGKGRSSLYYYYKSKDEVFDAVMDVEIGEIVADFTRAVEQAVTTEQKIRAFCLSKIKISRKRKAFFEALESGMNADEISQYTQKKQAIHKRIKKEESTLLHQVITQGIKKGELAAIDAKEVDTIIFVLCSSLRGIKREVFPDYNAGRAETAIDTLVKMVMQVLTR